MNFKHEMHNIFSHMLDSKKPAAYQDITSLKHDVLECCVCGSKEGLIRVPELICEIWCISCAERQKVDE